MRFRSSYLFVLLALSSISLAQPKETCHDDALPTPVRALLKEKFPDWRPKHLLDLDPDDRKLWLETHAKECPGIVAGHFEQPDRMAYAILLLKRDASAEGYKIVVLSKESDQYAVRVLDHGDESVAPHADSGLIISKEPPGMYSGCCESKSVRLKLDGVNVEWLEKSSVLYYWSNGKYQSLATSD